DNQMQRTSKSTKLDSDRRWCPHCLFPPKVIAAIRCLPMRRDTPCLPLSHARRFLLLSAGLIFAAALAWAAAPVKSKAPEKAIEGDHSAKMARGLDIFKKQVRPALVQQCV